MRIPAVDVCCANEIEKAPRQRSQFKTYRVYRMTIAKSRKDFFVTCLIGVITGVVGDAIWDGVRKIDFPHINGSEIFQLVYFIVVGLVGVFLGRKLTKKPAPTPIHAEIEPQIFIAAQSPPVTIRSSETTVCFTIFSCSALTLTFVELRLGTKIFKELFQESIEAFNPRFISLRDKLDAGEVEQIRQQLKASSTMSLFGTVKFGKVEQNFEFTVVPFFTGGMI
jgi:hypothetical protein